jgi:hypothetical protein
MYSLMWEARSVIIFIVKVDRPLELERPAVGLSFLSEESGKPRDKFEPFQRRSIECEVSSRRQMIANMRVGCSLRIGLSTWRYVPLET